MSASTSASSALHVPPPPPPNTRLLIGVVSYRSPVALARRNALRWLLDKQTPSPDAFVRFVLSVDTPDGDAGSSDMLTFKVPESGRTLGTYLLINSFFRYAVAVRPRIPFIARADDDSAFDVPTVLAELLTASCANIEPCHSRRCSRIDRMFIPNSAIGPCDDPELTWKSGDWGGADAGAAAAANAAKAAGRYSRRRTPEELQLGWVPSRDIVYGPFKEWYMWARKSMQATCFDFSPLRHSMAVARLAEVRGDVTALPRFQRECLHADLVGPFPFAKGPLVAFSHGVAQAIVDMPELKADGRRAHECL